MIINITIDISYFFYVESKKIKLKSQKANKVTTIIAFFDIVYLCISM